MTASPEAVLRVLGADTAALPARAVAQRLKTRCHNRVVASLELLEDRGLAAHVVGLDGVRVYVATSAGRARSTGGL